ncbi:MAG: hypothetical protein P4L53_29355 [Candidatus Obscuribacterales bacterium]|nr:hypothetical protein [Candidatus Obscuribacterales bacterium]
MKILEQFIPAAGKKRALLELQTAFGRLTGDLESLAKFQFTSRRLSHRPFLADVIENVEMASHYYQLLCENQKKSVDEKHFWQVTRKDIEAIDKLTEAFTDAKNKLSQVFWFCQNDVLLPDDRSKFFVPNVPKSNVVSATARRFRKPRANGQQSQVSHSGR